MPSEFACEIDAEFSVPDFVNADIPLKQIADRIATDSRRNIRQQTNINGSAYARLSKKTIRDKIREGAQNPRMALYRKGIMYRAIHVYKRGRNSFEVGIVPLGKPRRDLVGMIHQQIGPVIRTFLGFTTKTRRWAQARMERWLAEKMQKAAKKYIKLRF